MIPSEDPPETFPDPNPAEAAPAANAAEAAHADSAPPADDLPPWTALAAAVTIALATAAAYSNTFSCPFLFDDDNSIASNASIRHLTPLARVLAPPGMIGETVGGRPLLNFSLALNYAVSGLHVWSYHAANLAIHILAALTLFGIVRRTLRPLWGERDSVLPAFAAALLWAVHPLQTESVTYTAQRAESMCGLFVLLTLYCFIRAAGGSRSGLIWYALSWAAFLAAVLTKEVAATLPVLILLYDRTWITGRFWAAFERRYLYYLGLAAGLIVLGLLIGSTGWNRGNTIGFAGTGVHWTKYALSEFPAYVRYLRLSLWPNRLCLDYGTQWATGWHDWLPGLVVVAILLGGTLWALVRRPALGFLGAWFFIILAPSSSFIPGNRQTIAEHRMYLSLAAVTVLVVVVVRRLIRGRPVASLVAAMAAAAAAGTLVAATWVRNLDYATLVRIFESNVDGAPANPFAFSNYGHALSLVSRNDEAESAFQQAIHLKPDYATAWYNLGTIYGPAGRTEDALRCYKKALSIDNNNPLSHSNLGNLYMQIHQPKKAIAEFRAAVGLFPTFAEAHYNLGNALADTGQLKQAVGEYALAVSAKPEFAEAHNNLGVILGKLGRPREALEQFRQAENLAPDYPQAHVNLAEDYLRMGRRDDAISEYRTLHELEPDLATAKEALDKLLKTAPAALPPPPPAP